MPKLRRRPPRQWSDLSRLVVPLGLSLTLMLCVVGFVKYSLIVLDKQAHFAPGSEHPYDGYAVGCLLMGMIALAGLLLNLRDPPPMRWRRARRISRVGKGKRRAKPGRRSGTIRLP